LQSRPVGRHPAVPNSQLKAIEQALLQGAGAHGVDGDVWTSARVAVVIQRVTGVQLGSKAAQALLRDRPGWSFQPAATLSRTPLGTATAWTAAKAGRGAGRSRR
jgi:hypothetical protein